MAMDSMRVRELTNGLALYKPRSLSCLILGQVLF